jgi:hypothetical protein
MQGIYLLGLLKYLKRNCLIIKKEIVRLLRHSACGYINHNHNDHNHYIIIKT